MTEIDEKEYISLKIIVSELRNQYVSIAISVIKQMILKIQVTLCMCCLGIVITK